MGTVYLFLVSFSFCLSLMEHVMSPPPPPAGFLLLVRRGSRQELHSAHVTAEEIFFPESWTFSVEKQLPSLCLITYNIHPPLHVSCCMFPWMSSPLLPNTVKYPSWTQKSKRPSLKTVYVRPFISHTTFWWLNEWDKCKKSNEWCPWWLFTLTLLRNWMRGHWECGTKS